jgi:hypothetical protein
MNTTTATKDDIKELLQDSSRALSESKEAKKTINSMAKDAEKALGVPASTLKYCKNLYYTKGKGWTSKTAPLSLDSEAKVKDKFSQLFIKLRDVIANLREIGHTDWLDDYITALDAEGIHLTMDAVAAKTSSPDEAADLISSLCAYQAVVDESSQTIKEEHAQKSEDLNFAPKSKYAEVASLYSKIQDGKDVDDEFQDKITSLEMLETALNLVYDGAVAAPNGNA